MTVINNEQPFMEMSAAPLDQLERKPIFHPDPEVNEEIGYYYDVELVDQIIAAKTKEIERLKEQNHKFKWQVRDICTRAETAEQESERLSQQCHDLNEELRRQANRIIVAFDPDNDLDNPEKFIAYHDLKSALNVEASE